MISIDHRKEYSQGPTGVTLIELMVVTGVIGILVAMLLPAVQQSRAAARRLQCTSHLREIGIGTHSCIEQTGHFPLHDRPLADLLPYVEQAALHELVVPGIQRGPGKPYSGPGISLYVCPSDPHALVSKQHLSYRLNYGATPFFTWDGFRKFNYHSQVRPSDISDGLSNTAYIAERAIAPQGPHTEARALSVPLAHKWHLAREYQPSEGASFIQDCLDIRNHAGLHPGLNYGLPDLHGTEAKYNHAITPNRRGCLNGPPGSHVGPSPAALPATSYHTGGVNALFADGHVKFVSENIDLEVWHSLGTRAGGEPTPDF